ncbi:beta-1,4-galactosyltransferase 1-like isoform X2 [Cyprinodon tularosa]|uniref:beta-1,4-galactosyltransferase 1-like isoform X1 n=1 Tax=Cyprinodon tularosa TaxID=77115 RepID=UPI0018E1EDF6|nr:beta-1,4-galactosyltransferase 1-like isoform X1 [Cyprinodon tularosa]XP_038142695.1 beta-1,4-galactosyltransferase 1-like isoform X1 [Cyprinodon tularosa]XP_038142696.1 beta-1,4-galactosyltransferase 1-like isoform X2 [Cyprinodon tularosa]
MLKKLLACLSLFVFISLLFYAVVLFYGKNLNFSTAAVPRIVLNRNQNFSWKIQDDLQVTEISHEITVVPVISNRTLEPCPETPPNLVGPLLVEFNTKRTLEEVTQLVGSSLQPGGRYKPTDCISQHKVAIIIPFRNRHEHLNHLLYYIHPILIRQQLDYGVYVINQEGEGVFNRAKLMNVGFLEAQKEYDYECFVFSDVDLVPLDDRNLYRCFDNPRHLAVAMDKFNFHLPYTTYFGGVSSLSKQQFLKINGCPNTYWGWGGEDDDIYRRVVYRGMSISRPDGVTGKYKMVRHQRDKHNEPNPKNPDKLAKTKQTMDKDGLNSLSYTVKEILKRQLFTFITVDIQAPAS